MNHDEVEELLAAYALDAVAPTEKITVESHIASCGRCRAELAEHRELASLFAASPIEAPGDLWRKISAAICEPDPEYAAEPPLSPVVPIGVPRETHRRARLASGVLGVVATASAVLIILLGVQISRLDHQVASMRGVVRSRGLAAAVSAALVNPHREAVLTSAHLSRSAEVIITPSGDAYWVKSNLPRLSPDETYQVWAVENGQPISVGLVGRDPDTYCAFRLDDRFASLLVTVEPSGGATTPTGAAIVSGVPSEG